MTTETRVTVAEERKAKGEAIGAALQSRREALSAMLGGSDDRVDRFIRVAWQATSKNPDLLECSLESLVRSIMEAAQYGVEPTGPIGGAHLVPYKGVATLIIDYRGLKQMAVRFGDLADAETVIIYEGDYWDIDMGLEPRFSYIPAVLRRPAAERGGYLAVVTKLRLKDGERHVGYMTMAEIDAVRDRTGGPKRGPWITDYGEMARKTALRRELKLYAVPPEIDALLAREDELGADDGVSGPSVTVSSGRRSRVLAAVGAGAAVDTPEPVVEPAPADLEAEKAAPVEAVVAERDPELSATRELFAELEEDAPPEDES